MDSTKRLPLSRDRRHNEETATPPIKRLQETKRRHRGQTLRSNRHTYHSEDAAASKRHPKRLRAPARETERQTETAKEKEVRRDGGKDARRQRGTEAKMLAVTRETAEETRQRHIAKGDKSTGA